MTKKLLFIYNPCAGKGRIRGKLSDIIEILNGSGYEVTVCPTKQQGDAVNIAREKSSEYSLVVCCGGDGTLDEVVTGIMEQEKSVPIGYIPAGSTNDFGISLGLPKTMVEAAQIAVEGKRFSCDIVAFNKGTFVYISAFGIFTDVSYETPQSSKNILGHAAYVLEGLKKLSSLRTYELKAKYNGETAEGEFLFGMISNSTSVGGFKKITGKYVELNDGLFEVMLIRKPKNALELNQIIAALVMESMDASCIIYAKTDKIKIESKEPVAWTLDGEFGGEHCNVEIISRPRAVEIMVPDFEIK